MIHILPKLIVLKIVATFSHKLKCLAFDVRHDHDFGGRVKILLVLNIFHNENKR